MTVSLTNAEKSKRPREEGAEPRRSYLDQFLGFDTDALAAAGRHDAAVIAELESFHDRLQASIAAVKKERDDEEKAIQDEIARKAEEEDMKQRKKLIAEKRCFLCSAIDEDLQACVEYKQNLPEGEASKHGVLFCNSCSEKEMTHSCSSCGRFLHGKLSKDFGCSDCMDDSYTCQCCEEVFCPTCADGQDMSRDCENCVRGSWYCESCAGDSIGVNRCCQCDKGESLCKDCSLSEMRNCEGECKQPVCDDCICRLACGNDVRLCGDCDYDCEDCDMCQGYYSSRWA